MTVERAASIGEQVLFPAALDTDASPLVPLRHLDVLADAGFYGLAGPREFGGLDADLATASAIVEVLAAACLTTTFVWIQHHGAVRAVASSGSDGLQDKWLRLLCDGRARAGVALGGVRPTPLLRARPAKGGWIIDGTSPWVTGWGRIDVIHTAARTGDGTIVWALVDAIDNPALAAAPIPLVAVAASGTTTLTFTNQFVPAERVTEVVSFEHWTTTDAGRLRLNGSLALGVAGRSCRLLGPSPLDAELVACRAALDASTPTEMPASRAAASELAMRATATLIVAGGSTSIVLDHHAQRLAREAMFLAVFGSRPPIRSALLERVSRNRLA